MGAVTLDLDQEREDLLGDLPEAAGRTLRDLAVVEVYRRHAIAESQGGKRLGMTLEVFFKLAVSRHIPIFDITPEQWKAGLDAITASWARPTAPG